MRSALMHANAISIHALREEGDQLSMLPLSSRADFYPRPPRGGRHEDYCRSHPDYKISIHALREEGDVVRDGPMLFCC